MKRDPKSHKTQNGTVAVVGGCHRMHGAPVFAALGAEASGVDLIYPVVHSCNEMVTRQASLNFIVSTFKGKSLTEKDVVNILKIFRELDVAVIGPGMEETKENSAALQVIVSKSPCNLVLDARALRPEIVSKVNKAVTCICTPHLGELEYLTGQDLTNVSKKEIKALVTLFAREKKVFIVLKGHEDLIVSPDGKSTTIKGGNAGLTKGGTGDVLSGLIAGLLAQGMKPMEACATACTIIKRAATVLYPEKGYAFTAKGVIEQIPHLLHAYE
jgi:NAD(P)H-hydrate epimerase